MMQDEVAQTQRAFQELRRAMVDNQIRTFDVTDQRVLEAFYQVPRDIFLPVALQPLAYSDAPITLPVDGGGEGRVLMLPMFLAKLLQNADLGAASRVLVVANATGYAAAVVARLAASVTALDCDADYCETARKLLTATGAANVDIQTGPLAEGCKAKAPYDVILVNGAVEDHLEALFDQLAPGGRLVTVSTKVRSATRRSGKAVRYDKIGGEISMRVLFDATLPVLPDFRESPAFVF